MNEYSDEDLRELLLDAPVPGTRWRDRVTKSEYVVVTCAVDPSHDVAVVYGRPFR